MAWESNFNLYKISSQTHNIKVKKIKESGSVRETRAPEKREDYWRVFKRKLGRR